MGMSNDEEADIIYVSRQPNANIIDTVDRIKALLPQFRASLPPNVELDIDSDRTLTIRSSVHDAKRNMIISIVLVVLVVFLSAQHPRHNHSQRLGACFAGWDLRRDVPVRLQPGQPVAAGAGDRDRVSWSTTPSS